MTDIGEPDDELEALRALSAQVGADPLLVQGAGGNTSIKRDGLLHVKASGTWLENALRAPIFTVLDLARTRAIAEAGGESFSGAVTDPVAALRPSIETPFHALLPQRVVIHVHSINAIAWSVQQGAREEVARRMAGVDWIWIDYARPGQPLTRALIEGIAGRSAAPDLIIFQNHGIVVCGDTCQQARARLLEVERRLRREATRPVPAFERARLDAAVSRMGEAYEVPADHRLHALALDEEMLARAQGGALVPDHVVFLGDATRVLADGAPTGGAAPPYWLVPGAGVLVSRAISRGAYAMLQSWFEVLSRIPPDAALVHLAPADVSALGQMESEKYRQALERTAKR